MKFANANAELHRGLAEENRSGRKVCSGGMKRPRRITRAQQRKTGRREDKGGWGRNRDGLGTRVSVSGSVIIKKRKHRRQRLSYMKKNKNNLHIKHKYYK